MMGIYVSKALTLRGRSAGFKARLADVEKMGRTQTEARENLIAHVEVTISGSFEPSMFGYGDLYALVWREIDGWHYRIGKIDELDSRWCATVTIGTHDRHEAVQAARRSLVQMAYPDRNGLDLLWQHGDDHGILDQIGWLGFQRAYAFARDTSQLPEQGCHNYACSHGREDRWLTADEIEYRDRSSDAIRRARG